MEFMDGGSLHSLLCDVLRLPEHVARFYSAEIILAVSFIHKCGIVHGRQLLFLCSIVNEMTVTISAYFWYSVEKNTYKIYILNIQ